MVFEVCCPIYKQLLKLLDVSEDALFLRGQFFGLCANAKVQNILCGRVRKIGRSSDSAAFVADSKRKARFNRLTAKVKDERR